MGVTYYDAINKLLRVDTVSGAGTGHSIYDGSFTHFNNFTSGIEYYLNTVTGVCEPAGLDYWNDWCYGTVNQTEIFVDQIVIGQTTVNIYENGEFYFGGSNDATCQPVVFSRPDKGMTTVCVAAELLCCVEGEAFIVWGLRYVLCVCMWLGLF